MLAVSTDKTESPKGLLSSLFSLKTEAKGSDKFSLLLKSFDLSKTDAKDLLSTQIDLKGLKLGNLDKETGDKLDPLLLKDLGEKKETKTQSSKLVSLLSLGKEDAGDEEQFHPDILKAIPLKDAKQNLQALIGEAKSYLKEQIAQKTDLKELPKTLGGLIKLAEKSGIDVKAINFESLTKSDPTTSPFSKELIQAVSQVKTTLPPGLSTSQIVKPAPIKAQAEAPEKPLNALLKKADEIATPSIPVVDVLEETVTTSNKTALPSSITALLHGENTIEEGEGELQVKVEGAKEQDKPLLVTQTKTEALAQKISEAKQLVTHVAQNIKESLENYKPPFTRIKMQLNPQKFGDMDVTLIQRGSNVHININANSTALTVMMQNAHELKAQLSSQGLGDASMNFSSQQQQQGESKHKQEQAGLSYEEYQDFDEEFTEIATALEVVVPRYI